MSDQGMPVLWHGLAAVWGAGSVLLTQHVLRHARRLFDIPVPVGGDQKGGRGLGLHAAGVLAGALAALVLFSLFENPWTAWFCLAVCTLCLMTALLDWQEHVVPDLFVAGLVALAVLWWLTEGSPMLEHLLAALLSGLAMAGLMWLSAWRRLERQPSVDDIAWGDVTLISGLALLIGWTWLALFWVLVGPAHALLHLCTRKGRAAMKSGEPLPMAPALCIAGCMTLLGIHAGWLPRWVGI
jgi:prepilin signal peptidase PulO-like enzyme (type II secretory pathway)